MTTPAPHVRIWRQPDGWWRWSYVEPSRDDGQPELTLISHRAYETHDEARSSALASYPGINVPEPREPETETEPHQPETHMRPRRKARRLALVALALGYVVWRRWRAWWGRLSRFR
jgi:hypothetical protein